MLGLYQKQIENLEEMLDYLYDDLGEIWEDLSEKGQTEIQEYIDNAFQEAIDQYNIIN